jgi:hypothetical protein
MPFGPRAAAPPGLDFVQDHQPGQRTQDEGGVGKSRLIVGIFKIKQSCGAIPACRKLPRQGRFPDLAWAQERKHRDVRQALDEAIKMDLAWKHSWNLA